MAKWRIQSYRTGIWPFYRAYASQDPQVFKIASLYNIPKKGLKPRRAEAKRPTRRWAEAAVMRLVRKDQRIQRGKDQKYRMERDTTRERTFEA